METLRTSERIPTKEELTRLVDSFVETVKCLMDIRNTPTETDEDVRRRHRNDDRGMDYYFSRPSKSAFEFYRKTVLEDGTEIRLVFNSPNKSLNDGKAEVKIEIKSLPADKFIKVNRLKNAGFHTVRISNYSIGNDDHSTPPSKQILPGFQLLAEDCKGGEFDVDGSKYLPEKNSICGEILHELHKLIVDAMYQPYQKPVRNWFQKVFS